MKNTDFAAAIAEFTVDRVELRRIAATFRRDIELKLSTDDSSSLRALPSYLALPTGLEQGRYAALDFGGTNARASLVELNGDGSYTVTAGASKPLRLAGRYDYLGSGVGAAELFDFIAAIIERVAGEEPLLLGHTFSFPTRQTSLNDAELITWTKELAVSGVEGQNVNRLLAAALARRGLERVKPVAVLNDTVATVVAAAYSDRTAGIGSICATGHNTAYFEPDKGMIVNLESGHFNKLASNKYDQILDCRSERPGEQRLEKMVSGRYLGELFSLALTDVMQLPQPYAVSTEALAQIAAGDNGGGLNAAFQIGDGVLGGFDRDCAAGCRLLAESIIKRSARIIAATYGGIIWHLDGDGIVPRIIAIDGSLYEKIPLFRQEMRRALYELLDEDSDKITVKLAKDASAVGAAIAAATA